MGRFSLMELPDKIKIQSILMQGGAFKTKLQTDSYDRFYFVLNFNPKEDIIIVLSTSTTQFELHRNCPGDKDVHLPLSQEDYTPFFKNCLICCNRPVIINKNSFIKKLQSGNYELLPPLPSSVIEKIKHGIAKSPVVEPKIKQLVLGTNG